MIIRAGGSGVYYGIDSSQYKSSRSGSCDLLRTWLLVGLVGGFLVVFRSVGLVSAPHIPVASAIKGHGACPMRAILSGKSATALLRFVSEKCHREKSWLMQARAKTHSTLLRESRRAIYALARGSDLARSLLWLMSLSTIIFFCAVITGSGGLRPLHGIVTFLAQQEDKGDQNSYANAHPYLEEPLKEIVKRIPELRGLRPEEDQQALPMILQKSGERVDEFFQNVVDLLAHEEIDQERLNRIGNIVAGERVRDSYLILRHHEERGANFDEYRMDEKGNRLDKAGLDKGFFVTSGFALSCEYFSTAFQKESMFLYLGSQNIDHRDTYVVAFAQKPDRASLFVAMTTRRGASVHMLMQGILWVDKRNFQIIRTRMDLLAPRSEIGLEQLTTVVALSKVQLLDVATPLWLPRDVRVYLKFKEFEPVHGQFYEVGYRNEHHYANYQHYGVSVKINPSH